MRMSFRASILCSCALGLSLLITPTVRADGTPQTLPFTQDWTNTGLITANDNWSGVPGIVGYNGLGMGTSGTADPQTLLGTGTETLQVFANQTATTLSNGGVAEFDGLPNPVVAFQGSGTAGAPNIVITINTMAQTNIMVAYLLRDLDAMDMTTQHVALQYRVGTSGNYTNLAAGYVASATMAGATFTTMVNVVLPAACENQPLVEIRVITANAPGADEWVGVDNISITAGPTTCGNGMMDAGETCDTGVMNGTTPCGCTRSCVLAATGTMCAASGGMPCDAPDTCDGAGACAPRVASAGSVCRASMGLCDPAETCDGSALTCPADMLIASGTTCRPAAAGGCDIADTCNGTTAACTDVLAPNGTSCDDTIACNGADTCMTGACMHAGTPDCSDTDACTMDMCVEGSVMCMHTPVANCCSVATDCDDHDACTTNACTHAGGVCTFDPIADCCSTSADCDDGDACTTDACDAASTHCTHVNSCVDAGRDSGVVPHDAGAGDASHTDGGSVVVDAGHITLPHASSGCACTTAGGARHDGWSLVALALIGLVMRRRRSSVDVSSQ